MDIVLEVKKKKCVKMEEMIRMLCATDNLNMMEFNN